LRYKAQFLCPLILLAPYRNRKCYLHSTAGQVAQIIFIVFIVTCNIVPRNTVSQAVWIEKKYLFLGNNHLPKSTTLGNKRKSCNFLLFPMPKFVFFDKNLHTIQWERKPRLLLLPWIHKIFPEIFLTTRWKENTVCYSLMLALGIFHS
jgi:hypothetical protein